MTLVLSLWLGSCPEAGGQWAELPSHLAGVGASGPGAGAERVVVHEPRVPLGAVAQAGREDSHLGFF